MSAASASAALTKTAAAPLVDAALTGLEKALGGRDQLVAALAHAPKSKNADYLLGLLGDPTRAKSSLADLCAAGGITAGELIDAYKAGQLNRAQAISLKDMDTELPKVVADTIKRALPGVGVCGVCDGAGEYTPDRTRRTPDPQPVRCKACKGTGEVTVDGDLEHKKLVLEIAQVTTKGGGVNIAVNQQTALVMGGAAGGALERLQLATDQILYGDRPDLPLPIATAGDYTPADSAEVLDGLVVEPATAAAPAASAATADAQVEEDWQGQDAEA